MSLIYKKREQICSVEPKGEEINCLALKVKEIIQSSGCQNEDVIFLCIGSDRSVGDSLGPLVGTMLKEHTVPYRVYGTLEYPVHAFNIKDTLKEIKKQFKKPLIFSVDACLGDQNQVGYVFLKNGPLVPGKALKKVLPEVGDYHIIGMVNYIDPLPTMQFLNDTRLYTVMNLANKIVKIITQATGETSRPY
ncbi:spore protease YyaC [Peribacillus simplex]|uniref:spore protease YyaC n=1 Tax=Peribacillus simplex TaxID=1478 RepID=UPI0011A21B80|nr:spore protease YyaC [Peribacillus simplex]